MSSRITGFLKRNQGKSALQSPPQWLCLVFGAVSGPVLKITGLDPGRGLMQFFNPSVDVRRSEKGAQVKPGCHGIVARQENAMGTFVGFYPRQPKFF